MREILFRGKRVDNNEYVFGVPYTVQDEASFIINNCRTLDFTDNDTDFQGHKVIPETLCQYTGIKDKNGIKVFENDIILWGNNNKSIVEWGIKRKGFVIKYEYVDYEINDKKYYKTKYYNIGNSKDIEVIGNIYETKKDSV